MMKIMKDKKYIPVYEYARKRGVSSQKIYRWIREGKISAEDYKWEEITTKRLRIKSDLSES
jgi:predicted site-specific integrase-resolvase